MRGSGRRSGPTLRSAAPSPLPLLQVPPRPLLLQLLSEPAQPTRGPPLGVGVVRVGQLRLVLLDPRPQVGHLDRVDATGVEERVPVEAVRFGLLPVLLHRAPPSLLPNGRHT